MIVERYKKFYQHFMYVSVIKNVSLKYEAGGPRVERFFKEPLSTPTEVFYFNLEVLKFQFGGEIKFFFAFSPLFSSLYTLFLLKNAPLICALAVFFSFFVLFSPPQTSLQAGKCGFLVWIS